MKSSLLETTLYDNNNSLLQSNMLVTPYATEDATSPLLNDENYNNEKNTLPSTTLFSSPKKNVSKRRSQVKNACVNCQKACKKCDEGRPCQRCIKLGITDTCFDSPRKERKKGFKRGPYRKKSTTTQPNISPKKDVLDVTSPLFTTTVIKKEQKPTTLTINTTVSSPPVYQDSALYAINPVERNKYYDFPTSEFNNSFDETSLQTQFMTSNNNMNHNFTSANTPASTHNSYYNSTLSNISYQPYQNSNEYYYPNHNNYNHYYDNTTSSSPEDSFTANLPNWTYTELIENPLYNHTQNTSPFVPKLGYNAVMATITPNNKHQNYESNNKYDIADRNNTTIFNDQQWLTNGALEMYYYPSNVMY